MKEIFVQRIAKASSRTEIEEIVADEAAGRIAKNGTNPYYQTNEEIKVWAQHPEAQVKYEALAVSSFRKAETPTMKVTKSEIVLDRKARRIQKLNPDISYPAACAMVLEVEPGLYTSFEKEMATDERYSVPEHRVDKAGDGTVEYLFPDELDNEEVDVDKGDGTDCSTCGGTGKGPKNRQCPDCSGSGVDTTAMTDTEKAKKTLLRKLDSLSEIESRLSRIEGSLRR